MRIDRRWQAAPFPPAHCAATRALAFSPDGSRLATAGHDGVVRVWQLDHGRLLSAYAAETGEGGITGIAWPERGFYVAGDGRVGRHPRAEHPHSTRVKGLTEIAASLGNWIVTTDPKDDDALRWWDCTEGRYTRTTRGGRGVLQLDWCLGPDGETAYAIEGDAIVTIRCEDGVPIARWDGPRIDPRTSARLGHALAVSSGGTAALEVDRQLWLRGPDGEWRTVFLGDSAQAFIYALRFSPDGAQLAVSHAERRVSIVHVATGTVVRTLDRTPAGTALAFGARGRQLHILYEGVGVGTWDVRRRVRAALHRMPNALSTGRLAHLAIEDGRPIVIVEGVRPDVEGVPNWHPCGGEVTTWDAATDRPLVRMDAPALGPSTRSNLAAAWPWIARGSSTRVGCGFDHGIVVWDGRTGTRIHESNGERHRQLAGICIHPSGRIVWRRWCGRSAELAVVDVTTGEGRTLALGLRDWFGPLSFAPDASRIVISEEGPQLWVVDLATGHLVPLVARGGGAVACAWSADAMRIATGSAYFRWICLWHEGAYEPRLLIGHRANPKALAFSPDDRLLASTGGDGQVYLWSPVSGRLLAVFPAPTED